MYKNSHKNQQEDNQANQSCPPNIQEDITLSRNQAIDLLEKKARSQQINSDDQMNQYQLKQNNYKEEIRKIFGLPSGTVSEPKIQIKQARRGTDFDVQKVQSVQWSIDESIRSQNKSSQNGKSSAEMKSPSIRHRPRQNSQQQTLNVFVAGAQDTGKTTFIKCFLKKQRKNNDPIVRPRTKQLKIQCGIAGSLIKRNNVSFIDLPGFQDDDIYKRIYLKKIKSYAAQQSKGYKPGQQDKRVHLCLYFLRGPRIKKCDLEMMGKLANIFSLIPIISKSDQYTVDQILQMKQKLKQQSQISRRIEFFSIQQIINLQFSLQKRKQISKSYFGKFPPFVISASCQKQNSQSDKFIRQYPWGRVQIQNQSHTDFSKLSYLLSDLLKKNIINKTHNIIEESDSVMSGELSLVRSQVQDLSLDQINQTKWKNILIPATACLAIGGLVYLKAKFARN